MGMYSPKAKSATKPIERIESQLHNSNEQQQQN